MRNFVILASLVSFCAAAAAQAATRYVPTTSFPTIQSAINASASGDTVYVAPGDYHESLLIAKSLTIERQPLQSGDVDLIGSTSGILVRVSTLGTQVTLRNLRLWYGSPAIYGYISLGALPPNTNLPRLSLYDVYLAYPQTNGGILGNLHLRADDLTVWGSLGRGISIAGTADLVDVGVVGSDSYGIAVYNDFYTPPGWSNRLLRGYLGSNVTAGLYVKNHVGTGFQVNDSFFTDNDGNGVIFESSDGASIRTSTIELTQEINGKEGVAVAARGASVHLIDSTIRDNVFGVVALVNSAGNPARVDLWDIDLIDTGIELARDCESSLIDWGGNVCSENGHTILCQARTFGLSPC